MFAIDLTILNIALPEVGKGVNLSLTGLPWVISAYALPAAGFTLLFGRLGDLLGRRKLFIAGIALLVVGSLLGGFASSAAILLTARTIQGFAAALAIPAALSLITTTFTDEGMRGKVLGLNGALLTSGFTVGALVGGTLVNWFSWRSAFFINVPVGVLVLIATPLVISESSRPGRAKLDLPGAVAVTAGLLAVCYAVVEKNIVAAVVGAVLLVAFWLIELRTSEPLAPVRILKRPTVKWGNYGGLVSFIAGSGVIFMTTLYLQQVLHFSPVTTGLVFGIPGLAAVPAGIAAGRLLGSFGTRKVLVAGLVLQGLASLPIVYLGTGRGALVVLVPTLVILFFAHVINVVAYTVTGTSALPNEEQGLATGLTSMTQQIAFTVGVPIMASIAATQTTELTGIHLAVGVTVIALIVSGLFVWVGLRDRRQQPMAAVPVSPATGDRMVSTTD
jgi:MFS family permease